MLLFIGWFSYFCSRAFATPLTNQWSANILVKEGFAGKVRARDETHSTTFARMPEAQSLTNNTTRTTCARVRRASMSKSIHAHWLPNNFKSELHQLIAQLII